MYIDTHCHITSEDYQDIPKVIEEIKEAGVEKIIVNGCDMKSNMEVLDLVKKYDIVYGAIGFHPTELEEYNDECLNFLREHINDEKIVAIGEIGLDYHYDNTDREKEITVFRRQLEIAKEYHKPVIIHSRDAIQDTYNILGEYNVRGSIHCYSGSLEMAKEFIKQGFLLGVGGVCTYKNAKVIKNVLEELDLAYFVLETDAPYLTPEPYRGMKNSSKYIPIIAKKIADIKGVPVEKVAVITGNNAEKCFFGINE